MREVQLVSNDREGLPLNSEDQVSYTSFNSTFVEPAGADIAHDSLVDVVITVTAPAGTQQKK